MAGLRRPGEAFGQLEYPTPPLKIANRVVAEEYAAVSAKIDALYGQPPALPADYETTGMARDHHAQALAIARQLGTPPEEARALEGIGHSHLRDGHASDGAACLEQALAIYQRITGPAARRVQETLTQLRHDNLAPER